MGYDFDNNEDECWIHEDQNNFDNRCKSNANGVTQYRKVPCVTGTTDVCVVTYTSTDNKLSFGGSRDDSAVSVFCQSWLMFRFIKDLGGIHDNNLVVSHKYPTNNNIPSFNRSNLI